MLKNHRFFLNINHWIAIPFPSMASFFSLRQREARFVHPDDPSPGGSAGAGAAGAASDQRGSLLGVLKKWFLSQGGAPKRPKLVFSL